MIHLIFMCTETNFPILQLSTNRHISNITSAAHPILPCEVVVFHQPLHLRADSHACNGFMHIHKRATQELNGLMDS